MNLVKLVILAFVVRINVDARIVGGEDAEEGQFPYQISLRSIIGNRHFCGGSILNSRYLISAAHCVQGMNSSPTLVFAIVGALYRLSGGVKVELNKITTHEDWDSRILINDVSLLHTAKEITFTNNIQPIALPQANTEEGTNVFLSGWGQTNFPRPIDTELPNNLQFISLKTISHQECVKRFRNIGGPKIQESQVCTICPNNFGGGPLVDATDPENKVLIGIVSFGIPCAKGYPDVFTRVHSYLDWIKKHTS